MKESEEVSPLLLGHLRRNRVTSRMVGTDGCAPGRVTDSAATAEANRAAARGSCPYIKATARPPLKASPAAVESTARTLKAGTNALAPPADATYAP